jgi:formylmethanofuran dehydrogenase subunit E
MLNRIIDLEEADFIDIGDADSVDFKKGNGVFETKKCDKCGELIFGNTLFIKSGGG